MLSPSRKLTKREMEIYLLVVEEAMGEVAVSERLKIARHTQKRHMQHIFDKLGTSTRLELAVHYWREKLEDKEKEATSFSLGGA